MHGSAWFGCVAQDEDARDISVMAEESRTLWIETEYEQGANIPELLTRS